MKHVIPAAVVGAFVLAACGGRTVAPLPGTFVPETQRVAAAPTATVTVRVQIPHQRVPRFVSPATGAMRVAFFGPQKATFVAGLTPKSNKSCVKAKANTVCTLEFSVAPGKYEVDVTTYDRVPAHGKIPPSANVLATATILADLRPSKKNQLKLVLDGAPASLGVFPPAATAGTPFAEPQRVRIAALDADGNAIVGTYASPISLFDADASGATAIATKGRDKPPARKLLSSSDEATLSYTGLAIRPTAISASATGAVTATADFAPTLQPIVVVTQDSVNPSFAGIDLFAPTGTGSSETFTASEAGWTNAPFDRDLISSAGNCTIAAVAPASGTSFTAAVVSTATPGTCDFALSDGLGQSASVYVAYTVFSYTGAQQSFTLPAGVTSMTIEADGAQGGAAAALSGPTNGGEGGAIVSTLTATAGEALAIFVGGQGVKSSQTSATAGGFNGGGAAVMMSGTGGGASDVRVGAYGLSFRLIVGGGGGGGGGTSGFAYGSAGGAGGGATGAPSTGGSGGGGGSPTTGGAAGGTGGEAGTAGGFGTGGAGSSQSGGGGGGGYYGGGGGGYTTLTIGYMTEYFVGGGGGGSSFTSGTTLSSTQGTQSGNGRVVIHF